MRFKKPFKFSGEAQKKSGKAWKKRSEKGEERDILKRLEKGEITVSQALTCMGNFKRAEEGLEEDQPEENLKNILKELELLIGLEKIKTLIKEIQAYIEIQKRRQKYNLISEPLVLHMIFRGNPGTGKTTVARILGKLFKEMNVLTKGHLVEVERADLVGEYIGHTAQRTRDNLKKAMGGILFVDEAYSLARGGQKDFGKEAIDTLVKAMEDNKTDFILILAGYRQEMEHFLLTNPGLKSRFPIQIDFPDFTQEELLAIAELMLKNRQYVLSKEAGMYMKQILISKINSINFSNARFVRNIIERAIRRQALRLVTSKKETKREDLILITKEDLLVDPEAEKEELVLEKLFGHW